MSRSYALIIFDWDGTLADSTGEWVGVLQQTIQDIGLPERTPAQMRELVGLGIEDMLARLFPDRDPSPLRERFRGYFRRFGWPAPRSRLFAGAHEALTNLAAAGVVLAVATGKSRRGLDQAMGETDCRALFRLTRCADESAPKPAPNMVDDLLLRSAIEPGLALMVGDTEYDMAMAQAAGVDAIGVRCGVHDEARLRRAGAMDVIAEVAALPAWLASAAPGRSGQGEPGIRQ